VHGEPVNVPVPLLVNPTVPVGAVALPPETSVTVAVQVVVALTGIGDGVQFTVVDVARFVTVSAKVPELIAWRESPL